MDEILPVWAQPHSFWLLDDDARPVFTFGLVLTDLRLLRDPDGVRSFGGRFGYEWLPGLAAAVQRETGTPTNSSELEGFLLEVHGILGPNHLSLEQMGARTSIEPPDDVLQSFADNQGARIYHWSLNAFNMLDTGLWGWARDRQRVPPGYEHAAARRLQATGMQHRLKAVNGIDGRHRWVHAYTTLYERVALELEALAVRRPKPRICPLCSHLFIPLRPRQTVCGNQIWDAHTSQLVRRCVPPNDTAIYDAAAAADYRKRRKTRWAKMNRVRARHGHNDPRTADAIEQWEAWQSANPPPRPPGRPPTPRDETGPPYSPTTDR